MAYIEPKTNWIAGNIPVASDLNRIEGNTKQNHDDIAAEAVARDAAISVEEAARIADVDAEQAARIAADNTKYVVGGIGSMAFLFYFTFGGATLSPGDTIDYSKLSYSNNAGSNVSRPAGTWRCMGYAPNETATLFIRIS